MIETPEKKPEEIKESYVPKMKPGDVEIPNRVFVKGFPREATADDLFTFFEDYGKVLECRIVADRYGYSKGYGFITFDSQNIAEKVKAMEHIKYDEEIELAIGPARIRKKRFYLLPTPQYQQPQPYYAPDGSVFWATCVPQQQVVQPQPMVSPVQVVTSSNQNYGPPVSQQGYGAPVSQTYVTPVSQPYGTPVSQPYGTPVSQPYGTPVSQPYGTPVTQPYGTPVQHNYNTQQNYSSSPVQQNYGNPIHNYGAPVVLSVVTSDAPPNNQSAPNCHYQTNSSQNMNAIIEKVSNMTISQQQQTPVQVVEDAVVPTMNSSPPQYVDVQPTMNGPETIVYNPVVSFVPQQRLVQ